MHMYYPTWITCSNHQSSGNMSYWSFQRTGSYKCSVNHRSSRVLWFKFNWCTGRYKCSNNHRSSRVLWFKFNRCYCRFLIDFPWPFTICCSDKGWLSHNFPSLKTYPMSTKRAVKPSQPFPKEKQCTSICLTHYRRNCFLWRSLLAHT